MSAVGVVVMDCTEMGLSLPTPTFPTVSCRVGRRAMCKAVMAAPSPWSLPVGVPTLAGAVYEAPMADGVIAHILDRQAHHEHRANAQASMTRSR